MPKLKHDRLIDIYRQNVIAQFGSESAWREPSFGAGSTDVGDISHLMPCIETEVNGCKGTAHAADFCISDPYVAYVIPAKLAAMTIVDLLIDGAAGAKSVLAGYQPAMTKAQYLTFMRNMARQETWMA